MRWFIRGGLAGAGLLLGVLAGLVFGWMNNPLLFRWSAYGAAAVLSLLAVVSITPQKAKKSSGIWLPAAFWVPCCLF